MEYSQEVRQSFLVRSSKGSNPFIPKRLRVKYTKTAWFVT